MRFAQHLSMSSIRPDQSKSRRFAQERGPANGLGGPGALESSRKGNYTNGEPIALIIGWRAAINPPATKNPAYSESGRACPFGVLEGYLKLSLVSCERPERQPTNVVNLMEALRRSVEASGAATSATGRAPARRGAPEKSEQPKRKKARRAS